MLGFDVQHLFVGGVSVLMGVLLAGTGAADAVWLFQLRKARWLERQIGHLPARVLITSTGVALIVLGGLIASGFQLWAAN